MDKRLLLLLASGVGIGLVLLYLLRRASDSASVAAADYFSGIVRDANGDIDIGATIGLVNPSGIPAADVGQAEAARLAVQYGVPIQYLFSVTGQRSVDEAGTIREVARARGVATAYTWYGAVDVAATIQRIRSGG